MTNPFITYTVYSNPSDYPGKFVVRRQRCTASAVIQDAKPLAVVDSLEEARAAIPPGLVGFVRHLDDDPVIVEVWL